MTAVIWDQLARLPAGSFLTIQDYTVIRVYRLRLQSCELYIVRCITYHLTYTRVHSCTLARKTGSQLQVSNLHELTLGQVRPWRLMFCCQKIIVFTISRDVCMIISLTYNPLSGVYPPVEYIWCYSFAVPTTAFLSFLHSMQLQWRLLYS